MGTAFVRTFTLAGYSLILGITFALGVYLGRESVYQEAIQAGAGQWAFRDAVPEWVWQVSTVEAEPVRPQKSRPRPNRWQDL